MRTFRQTMSTSHSAKRFWVLYFRGMIAAEPAPLKRKLLDSIPADTVRDLRDRALIAILTYSFARITATLNMKTTFGRKVLPGGSDCTEKGGKHHTVPCRHALAEALHAYIAAAGIAEDRKGWLFRTSRGHDTTVLSELRQRGSRLRRPTTAG